MMRAPPPFGHFEVGVKEWRYIAEYVVKFNKHAVLSIYYGFYCLSCKVTK